MIQEEFKDVIFEFVNKALGKEIAYIFLFGSIAQGNADNRSDIDLLIVFDTYAKDFENSQIRNKISELSLHLEGKYNKNIQTVFTNKRFEGLDNYFVKEVMHKGILLYAKSPKIETKRVMLEPYVLVLYNLPKIDRKEKMKITRELLGHKTKKVVKGITHESKKEGIIKELGGKHLGRGNIIISQKKAGELEKALKGFNITYNKIDTWLAEDDIVKIHTQLLGK